MTGPDPLDPRQYDHLLEPEPVPDVADLGDRVLGATIWFCAGLAAGFLFFGAIPGVM